MARSEGWGRNVRNVGARGSNPLTSTHQQPLCRKGCSLFQDRFPIAPILDPPTSVRDRVGDELFEVVVGDLVEVLEEVLGPQKHASHYGMLDA